ncbi:cbb3-type cytochrome oxidase assembly protein CcoS [Azospirillum melinis]|jgi:cbb3-type cytochrome oxidase maturation protein|uniref:Cbb3-type cytochrome oxidase assembly protein CcoS n=2 Tax=Azospirillum TaxID=191 RepID=A0A2B8BA09_9PROT|nr:MULTISPECIES: cbb3-type cytochrome oxidase assembly protein CcoS [Azospirillum]MBP2309343.1 cbb3-type cytochrome oxidase maturation protein [Azospirillum melinis]NUB01896.1 cbb3-type cytochrome oxidase assembly protein CcoS [Azospirillum melinis]PGH54620.1 cbb3-type cytochrome oxidase assembly protein CcoS [Azospirillum palustre]
MDELLYLIAIALSLGGLGLAAFLWALKSGQFDDLDGAAHRVLFDDDLPAAPRAGGEPAKPAEAVRGQ